jgi:hypothetical protein
MFGVEQAMGWRIALIVPGVMMVIVGFFIGNLHKIVLKVISKNCVHKVLCW